MQCRQKIFDVDAVTRLVRDAQRRRRTVAMCHGCFDIVHPGHVRHLQHAARQADRLLVTITGDALVGKGPGRPLIPQELRAENLAALDCVDWVTVSADPTAAGLIRRIRPDVYVKGREYEHNRDPRFQAERDAVESIGGRVVFTSGEVVFSSSAIISAIEASADPRQSRLKHLLEQHDISHVTVDPLVDRFRGRRVVVVGECITDTYVLCDRPEIAGEGPIMTLRPIEYRSFDGGAAIVARHLAAMGATPILLTALPPGAEAAALRARLESGGVETHRVETPDSIIRKQRFLVGTTKIMKLDLDQPMTLDAARQRRLSEMASTLVGAADAIIVADFGQGLFTAASLEHLCEAVRPRVATMAGDVSGRRSSLLSMRGMDLICPGEREIRDALHDYDEGLSTVAWRVMDQTRTASAIVTTGDEGLITFASPHLAPPTSTGWAGRLKAEHVPSLAPFAVDELGCGDALLAAATLALVAGGSLVHAAVLGSIAASVQAQRLGNAVVGAHDLRHGVRRLLDTRLMIQTEHDLPGTIDVRDQLHPAHTEPA